MSFDILHVEATGLGVRENSVYWNGAREVDVKQTPLRKSFQQSIQAFCIAATYESTKCLMHDWDDLRVTVYILRKEGFDGDPMRVATDAGGCPREECGNFPDGPRPTRAWALYSFMSHRLLESLALVSAK
jgi:hypothetical protein